MLRPPEILRNGVKTILNSMTTDFLDHPIPIEPKSVEGWKQVPIKRCNEPLVPLSGPYADYAFLSDGLYSGERFTSPYIGKSMEGSLVTPFARRRVAEILLSAQSSLPEGYLFVIWDAYRTVEMQASLFNQSKQKLALKSPDLSEDDLLRECQRFVSLPSTDETKPSPHNTGGVIDLTIVRIPVEIWRRYRRTLDTIRPSRLREREDYRWQELQLFRHELLIEKSKQLDMGTPCDYVGPETATNYYENLASKRTLTKAEEEILRNRRMLYNALVAEGFTNYSEEWWHFSFGDQMWAKQFNKTAIYGAASLSQKNMEFEYWHREFFRDGHIKMDIIHPQACEI